MLDYFIYRYKIWRLQGKIDKNMKFYAKERNKIKKSGGSNDDLQSIASEEMWEFESTQNEIMFVRTQYILNTARRLFVPEPPFAPKKDVECTKETDWMYARDGSYRAYLTLAGQQRLESQIRSERAARSERLLRWIPAVTGMIGALTGVIGAVIGLIAIWHGNAK